MAKAKSNVKVDEIREILETLDITASEFARRTYVSRSYISHLISGRKSNPSDLWALQVIRLCREEAPNRITDGAAEALVKIADSIDGRINVTVAG